ncbi:MAG: hydrogenase small subunit [Solirubrobacteraceae bacterium]
MSVDRRAMFAGKMGPRPVSTMTDGDRELQRRARKRLRELEATDPLSGLDLRSLLAEHGIARRTFLKWVSATTAMLTLPPLFEPLVAQAAEVMNRVPVIWIEGQSCRGNSEAFLRADAPTVDELLFQVISLEFHQLVMAASGFQLEQRKAEAMKANYGKYILIVEGSIPTGYNGGFSTTGAAGTPFIDEVRQLSQGAAAVIAVGACATSAALPAADPNPTGALSTQEVITNKPIVNIPACPMNPANFVGTLLHFTLTGQLPALDSQLRPQWAFGSLIHDNCPRRAHFDAGEYVVQWGDEGAQNNFCLYKMGCKGPMSNNNCPSVQYNGGTSWPIRAGHGCIGCSEVDFWDRYAYERPLATANVNAPGLFGWGVENSVDKFGLGLLTIVGAGIAAHAVVSGVLHHRHERKPEMLPAEPPPSTWMPGPRYPRSEPTEPATPKSPPPESEPEPGGAGSEPEPGGES